MPTRHPMKMSRSPKSSHRSLDRYWRERKTGQVVHFPTGAQMALGVCDIREGQDKRLVHVDHGSPSSSWIVGIAFAIGSAAGGATNAVLLMNETLSDQVPCPRSRSR